LTIKEIGKEANKRNSKYPFPLKAKRKEENQVRQRIKLKLLVSYS